MPNSILDREQFTNPVSGDSVSSDNYNKDTELLRVAVNYLNGRILEGSIQDVTGQVPTYADLPDPTTLELGVRYLVIEDENTGTNYVTYVVRNDLDTGVRIWQISLIGVPLATAQNDGIMSSEAFVRLYNSPTQEDLQILQETDIRQATDIANLDIKAEANASNINVLTTSKADQIQPNNVDFNSTTLPGRVIENNETIKGNALDIIGVNNRLDSLVSLRGLANASSIKEVDRELTVNFTNKLNFSAFAGINDIIDDPTNPGNSVHILEAYADGIKAYAIENNNKDLSLQLLGGIWHSGAQDTTIRIEIKYDKPGNPITTVVAGFQDIVITADEVNHSIAIRPTLSKDIFNGLATNTPIDFYVEATTNRTNTFISSGLTFVIDERSDGQVSLPADTESLASKDPSAEGGATQNVINQATKLVGDKTAQLEFANGETLIDGVAVAKTISDLQTDKLNKDLSNVDDVSLDNKLDELGYTPTIFNVNVGKHFDKGIVEKDIFTFLEANWYDAQTNPSGELTTGSPVSIRFVNPLTQSIERTTTAEMISRVDNLDFQQYLIGLDLWVTGQEKYKKGTLLVRSHVDTSMTATVVDEYVFRKGNLQDRANIMNINTDADIDGSDQDNKLLSIGTQQSKIYDEIKRLIDAKEMKVGSKVAVAFTNPTTGLTEQTAVAELESFDYDPNNAGNSQATIFLKSWAAWTDAKKTATEMRNGKLVVKAGLFGLGDSVPSDIKAYQFVGEGSSGVSSIKRALYQVGDTIPQNILTKIVSVSARASNSGGASFAGVYTGSWKVYGTFNTSYCYINEDSGLISSIFGTYVDITIVYFE